MKTIRNASLLCLAALAAGCATQIKTSVVDNPPPSEKFSNFARIEMEPLRLVPPYAGQGANETALLKIQENLDLRMKPALQGWNAAEAAAEARTLRIVPVVEEIKFISGGNRFWAGAMAGSSAVKVRVRITDKASGALVAEPEFYARAAAMGGAWSVGGTDNAMLVRIANRLSDYLIANHPAAVGGPTGAEPGR